MDKVKKAYRFAINMHVNQLYGRLPYSIHLNEVHSEVKANLHYLTNEELALQEDMLVASWLHDVLEDTSCSYNKLLRMFGIQATELVYAVTNEKGRTRKEKIEKTYPELAKCRYAVFLKLCDRLANVKHSKETGSKEFGMYRREQAYFRKILNDGINWKEMWKELEALLKK